jgi:ribosomal protection tetracycline resistance protein
VGLRIEPAAAGSGLAFRSEVGTGWIPLGYLTAVEEVARATLRRGLYGWQVTDCTVTITHCDHRPPPVPVGGFRSLTPRVARAALARAGTRVCEPVHGFRLDLPGDTVATVLTLLAHVGAAPHARVDGGRTTTLEGEVRAARVDELRRRMAGLTRGEGVLETAFASYRPVAGPPPARDAGGGGPDGVRRTPAGGTR